MDRLAPHPPPQVVGELPGGLVAPGRLLGHRLQADRLQVTGDGAVELPRWPRRVLHDLQQEHPRLAPERHLPGQQLVQDHPEAVDVTAGVHPVDLAAGLLGTHIGGRAEHLAVERHGDVVGGPLGQAEIRQVRPPLQVQ